MKKWLSYTLVGATSAIVTLGAAAGAVVPLIMKGENALKNFIPDNHRWENKTTVSKDRGLNYVALGDSVAAGYNGFLKRDYVSFADFLANDMKNADVLGSYKNFAVSGQLISGMHDTITRDPSVMQNMQNADVITITIGANDLLSYVRLLDAQFAPGALGAMLGLPLANPNANRNGDEPSGDNSNPNDPMSVNDRWNLLNQSLTEGSNMFKTNNFNDLVSLQPKLVEAVYQFIERDMITLLADIGKVAPNADVIVTAHAFPFLNFPKSILDGNPTEDGLKSFMQGYSKFIDALKKATSYAKFAKFQAFDQIPEYANDQEARPDNPNDPIVNVDPNNAMSRYRKMPDIADIHPSTYGHSLIGNGLFHEMAQTGKGDWQLMNISNYQDFYTQSTAPNTTPLTNGSENSKTFIEGAAANFERLDESQFAQTNGDVIGRSLLREDKTRNMVSELFNMFSTKTIPTIDDPNDTLNTTIYQAKYTAGLTGGKFTFSTGSTAPSASNDSSQILMEALFGNEFDPSKPMLAQVQNLLKDPNLGQLLSSVGILINSMMQEGATAPGQGLIAPITFIQNTIKSYTTSGQLLTKQQYQAVNNLGKGGLANGSYFDYQDTHLGNLDVTQFGVKNAGQLVAKYTKTASFESLIQDFQLLPMALTFATPTFAAPMASNGGQDYLNQIKAMGQTDIYGKMQTSLTAAQKAFQATQGTPTGKSTTATITADGKKFYNIIDNMNVSINRVNTEASTERVNYDPNATQNDLWDQLASTPRGSVASQLQATATKINANNDEWKSLMTKIGMGANTSLSDFNKTITSLDTEFVSLGTITQDGLSKNLDQTVQDAQFATFLIGQTDPTSPIGIVLQSFQDFAAKLQSAASALI